MVAVQELHLPPRAAAVITPVSESPHSRHSEGGHVPDIFYSRSLELGCCSNTNTGLLASRTPFPLGR
jgi:hypothetical protein